MAQKISTHLLLSGFEARKPANQKGFDEIFEYCHLIYGEKLKFLTKLNLYCQTKVKKEFTLKVALKIRTVF
ncbi:MAG: hypothetical protein NHB15_05315 [Methanosarcina barkeri]|nr:hypothetical protein [Methanosarcina sp. ERenArc_MAG2]